MSLVTIAEARALLKTALTDSELQDVINRAEVDVTRLYGAHPDGVTTVTEILRGGETNLYLRRRIAAVTTVVETSGGSSTTLTAGWTDDYYVWGAGGYLERRSPGVLADTLGAAIWGELLTVTYLPYDDRAERRAVIIDLVRLALERTAMKSESVAGEYSYTAPDDWEASKNAVLQRLALPYL